jgi:hypothetical protein
VADFFDSSSRWRQRRFGVLVATLAAYLFVLAPLSRARVGGQALGPLILTVVAAAGIYACSHRRRAFFGALALALPAAMLIWFEAHDVTGRLAPLAWLLNALFIVFLLFVVGTEILRANQVTADTILGAIAVYLLLAMVWALMYAIISAVDPSAFQLPANDAARVAASHLPGDLSTFVYYSFVTLTTMGYGDILPLSDTARGLATCEAVIGQIYLTVTVARLVGMYIADTGHRQ